MANNLLKMYLISVVCLNVLFVFLSLRKLSPINEMPEVFVPVSSLTPLCDTGIKF